MVACVSTSDPKSCILRVSDSVPAVQVRDPTRYPRRGRFSLLSFFFSLSSEIQYAYPRRRARGGFHPDPQRSFAYPFPYCWTLSIPLHLISSRHENPRYPKQSLKKCSCSPPSISCSLPSRLTPSPSRSSLSLCVTLNAAEFDARAEGV